MKRFLLFSAVAFASIFLSSCDLFEGIEEEIENKFAPTITMSSNIVTISGQGGEQNVFIYLSTQYGNSSNLLWYASCNEDWIKLSPKNGSSGGSLKITASLNSTTYERVAKIYVSTTSDYSSYETITVKQSTLPNAQNAIFYTTSNGKVLNPTYSISGNNYVQIISNTYENGQGVIIFNGAITSIGDSAFYGCTTLTSMVLPNTVSSIGKEAFRGCSSLKSISLGNSLYSIGDYAFRYCSSMQSFTIPKSVYTIGKQVFEGCTGAITVDSKIVETNYNSENAPFTSTGGWLYGSKFSELIIGDNVTKVGDYALAYCNTLNKISIGHRVESIGAYAFYNCTSLKTATIHDRVASIGAGVFKGCTSLTSVSIPDSVTAIKEQTFYGCSSMKSLTIPNSITSIGKEAFYNCTGELIVNSRVLVEGGCTLASSKFTKITICEGPTKISSTFIQNISTLSSINIPNSVTSIEGNAFYGCSALKRVDITDLSLWCRINFTNSTANPLCFGAKLYINNKETTQITIPSSITSIKEYAFYGCTSLKSLTLPNSITSVGAYALYDCTGELVINSPTLVEAEGNIGNLSSSAFSKITIGNGPKKIANLLFSGCTSLKSVTIPNSVTSIGYDAFRGCTSLTSVYCKPTTPPTAIADSWSNWRAFYNNASGRKIYVPRNSVSAYKAASFWSDYASYIVGYDF